MEMRGMSGELLGTIGSSPDIPLSSGGLKPTNQDPAPPAASSSSRPKTSPAPETPTLPAAFISKKRKILSALHPDGDYTDKSPKGSVDAQIAELIDEINGYDGLVTTSSCAGRVSVFLEGGMAGDGVDEEGVDVVKAVPGGKGLGGKWLFVSHERLSGSGKEASWMRLFGLSPDDGQAVISQRGMPRLVKFAFEPLILHVLCASLKHAQPLLAAAVNAGFRESGVQSLRILEKGGEGVMVGIRTAGLGLESVIGVLEGEECRAVVSEAYLDLVVKVSGERFKANEERRERFRGELKGQMVRFEGKDEGDGWEGKEDRARRKREEGLRRRDVSRKERDIDHVGQLQEEIDFDENVQARLLPV